ncbi:hypothetical protein WN55_05696 [Dufourea novaeangliae]|uniref:Uncharacterized protein n=1 Tax=Dufourea novaeangliae TaxID=178035 RepID=A0A154PPJ1_DUFNO|nr:hypothetical protein WN55_05696 [Dufourea novaeangliae]
MAMVISPRSKIVTLSLLIGIIALVALIITGVIGILHKKEKPTKPGAKVVSSKLQQITGYTATKHGKRQSFEVKLRRVCHRLMRISAPSVVSGFRERCRRRHTIPVQAQTSTIGKPSLIRDEDLDNKANFRHARTELLQLHSTAV